MIFMNFNTYHNGVVSFNEYMILMLSNTRNITMFLLFPYIFLIYEITCKHDMENELYIRVGSRVTWWNLKIITLFVLTILYICALFLISFILSFNKVTYSTSWAGIKRVISNNDISIMQYKSFNIDILNKSSSVILVQAIFLILGGFISIASVIFVLSMILKKKLYAALNAIAIWILCIIPNAALKNSIFANLFFNHINIHTHSFSKKILDMPTVNQSLGYFLVLFLAMYFVGYILSGRKEFY